MAENKQTRVLGIVGSPQDAEQLLVRGFHRVGLAVPQGDSQALIRILAQRVAAMDPASAQLADGIVELHRRAFDNDQGG